MSEPSIFVLNCLNSPKATLKPLPLEQVRVDGYLGSYLKKAIEVTIPSQYELLENTGRIDNFRRASGKIKTDFQGYFFNDSDVYKWVEGCSYSLLYVEEEQREKLQSMLNRVIEEIVAAQDEDGYLNTFFTFEKKSQRWTDLANMHELYCAGHLIQAAIAHYRVTGERKLLEAAIRFADHIDGVFGPSKKRGTSGHPEIEMALVELFRETKDPKYLSLANYFVLERGNGFAGGREYTVDHKPFLQLEEMTGHAVRMLYLCCGATDVYLETGQSDFFDTLSSLWENMATKKMYVTGGVGSRYEGEAFGEVYELPNRRAYAETCAAIANFMWNYRMLLVTADGKFADLMEQVLYNGLLSGVSIDGKHYFYVNPLEDFGKHKRQEWFKCACCPTNLARFLPSLPSYIYTKSDNAIWVHLYEQSDCETFIAGKKVKLTQTTDYPISGLVEMTLTVEQPVRFDLMLRKPSWAEDVQIRINNEQVKSEIQKGYIRISREWDRTNRIQLSIPMNVRLIESHPYVRENVNKVALFRGPILFCAEHVDNPNIDVLTFAVDPRSGFEVQLKNDPVLGKTLFIQGSGHHVLTHEQLYKEYFAGKERKSGGITLVPYHLWANREAGPMVVWLDLR